MIKRLFVIILIIAYIIIPGCADKGLIGAEAPDFTLNTLTGQSVSLADFTSQPVVINFWQSRCPSCIEELPYFQTVYVSENKVAILTVAIGDSTIALSAFMKKNGYTFPVLLDPDAGVATNYSLRFTPTTFFINSQGFVVDVKVGPFVNVSQLERAIEKLD